MLQKLKTTQNVSLAISTLLFLVSLAIVQKSVEFLQVEALEQFIQDGNILFNYTHKIKDHHEGKKKNCFHMID